jgi:hypothetical protein
MTRRTRHVLVRTGINAGSQLAVYFRAYRTVATSDLTTMALQALRRRYVSDDTCLAIGIGRYVAGHSVDADEAERQAGNSGV